MADIDPLRLDNTRFRSHPDLDVLTHGLTLWDLDREFKVDGFAGAEYKKLRDVLSVLRDAYCRHVGWSTPTSSNPNSSSGCSSASRPNTKSRPLPSRSTFCPNSTPPRRSRHFCKPNTLGKNDFRWKARKA
ncbi:2-oxoglutarate decarboxylase domain protein [Mycobacterium xenopi 4042]|uniref:2-oxoglutarate decarboxylase domain protein n=1 Tax=Mycobacterium xenopi 4042 TaxID=1299334 RepID=X8DZJ0_MYCXE|nr:2-oxoglutarate decarboxylase domain protein [Mycobacterium xenopi 4042]